LTNTDTRAAEPLLAGCWAGERANMRPTRIGPTIVQRLNSPRLPAAARAVALARSCQDGGPLSRLAPLVIQFREPVLAGWVIGAAALAVTAPFGRAVTDHGTTDP